ncbi:MAG: hypothetical protein V2I33_21845, partial [Kangiellaceae bacterium]|nr:hypothetical protein [Kangiellaceae bacterium]
MISIFKSIFDGFLDGFKQDIKMMSTHFVNASIFLYRTIQQELKPTPTKTYYTFNLRDVSKAFQGMMLIDPKFTT